MAASVEELIDNLNQLNLINESPGASINNHTVNLGLLAVELRDPSTRTNPAIVSNLDNLIQSINHYAAVTPHLAEVVTLNLEILRVLVNLTAYNNTNRLLLVSNKAFATALEKFLLATETSTGIENQYGERVLILLENLTTASEDTANINGADGEDQGTDADDDKKKIAKIYEKLYENGVLSTLFNYFLRYVKEKDGIMDPFKVCEIFISFSEYFEFVAHFHSLSSVSISELSQTIKITLEDIVTLVSVLNKLLTAISNNTEAQDKLEEIVPVLDNLSYLLYVLSEYNELQIPKTPQKHLFELLQNLKRFEQIHDKSFVEEQNEEDESLYKGIIKQTNRRIFGAIGNLSSNLNNTNTEDIDLALLEISHANKESSSKNYYLISASLLILANSISKAEDRKLLLEKDPHLVQNVFTAVYPLPGSDVNCKLFVEYYKLAQTKPGASATAEEKQAVEKVRLEMTLFTEPVLGQSLFHLLKLLVTSSSFDTPDDPQIKTNFIEDFKNNYLILEKLILVNFNSLFFAQINLSLILKFLNKFVKNFLNYSTSAQDQPPSLHKWFINKFQNVFLSLYVSVTNDTHFAQGKEDVVKIAKLSPANRNNIIEVLQNLINAIVIKKVEVEEDFFTRVLEAIFFEKSNLDEDVSVGLQLQTGPGADEPDKLAHLSQKFITLTLLASSEDKDTTSFLISERISTKIIKLVHNSFSLVEQNDATINANTNTPEDFIYKGFKNNLKVFVYKMNNWLHPKSEDHLALLKEKFIDFLQKAKDL